MFIRRASILCALAALCLGVISACDTSVEPFIETENYFTLFGTLDMAADTQFVRVTPIRSSLESSNDGPLPVRFTSTDLTTGIQRTWRDSVISFSNGQVGHVFYAPFRVKAGHEYQITVAKGDSTSTASTVVPPRPSASVGHVSLSGGAYGRANGAQTITWRNLIRSPYETEVWYRFLQVSASEPPFVGASFVDVRIPHAPEVQGQARTWQTMLDLDDHRNMLDTLTAVYQNPLVGIGMRITVLDEAFVPPGNVFDFETLVQPGTFSNVTNGFGFVGSVGRFSLEWTLSPDEAERLGYVTLEELFGRQTARRIRAEMKASKAATLPSK